MYSSAAASGRLSNQNERNSADSIITKRNMHIIFVQEHSNLTHVRTVAMTPNHIACYETTNVILGTLLAILVINA